MKKVLSMFLALVLALSPLSAFAEDTVLVDYTVLVYQTTATNDPDPFLETTVTGTEGMTGTEVLKAALDEAKVDYVIESTEYGNYLSSLGGVSELQYGKLSGWLCAIDGDRFGNMGLDSPLPPNAVLELHYSVTGGEDVGATWGSLPILTELTLGGVSASLRKETDYETYTTAYYLSVADEETLLSGSGSEEDPFEISLTLPRGTNPKELELLWKSSLHEQYAELVGEEITDYSEPVSLALLGTTGSETYYTISVHVPSSGGGGGGGGGGLSVKPAKKEEADEAKVLKSLAEKDLSAWSAIALARSEAEVSQAAWDAYYASIVETVLQTKGVLSARKYTEYSKAVLALTALGANPENIAGYNLVAPLSDFEAVTAQGTNGAIWALIALDSRDYPGIRDRYVKDLLTAQNPDGGWSLSGDASDADLTAMALVALRNDASSDCIDAALAFLKNCNLSTCESNAQVLTALSALGKASHPLFETAQKNLLSYQTADGFCHTVGGETNQIATEQAAYALVAAKRAKSGLAPLFDMRDAPRRVSRFYDIIGHENRAEIESLAERGVIAGFPDGGFAPEKTMTRAEFCALITRALGLQAEGMVAFGDVCATDWYFDSVCAAVACGIVKGRTNGTFDPNAAVSVEESEWMIARAAKYMEKTESGYFEGLQSQAKESILRCEIAQVLYRFLEAVAHA